jgi:membrane protein implicated in regulation of membrane protease activity
MTFILIYLIIWLVAFILLLADDVQLLGAFFLGFIPIFNVIIILLLIFKKKKL